MSSRCQRPLLRRAARARPLWTLNHTTNVILYVLSGAVGVMRWHVVKAAFAQEHKPEQQRAAGAASIPSTRNPRSIRTAAKRAISVPDKQPLELPTMKFWAKRPALPATKKARDSRRPGRSCYCIVTLRFPYLQSHLELPPIMHARWSNNASSLQC